MQTEQWTAYWRKALGLAGRSKGVSTTVWAFDVPCLILSRGSSGWIERLPVIKTHDVHSWAVEKPAISVSFDAGSSLSIMHLCDGRGRISKLDQRERAIDGAAQ